MHVYTFIDWAGRTKCMALKYQNWLHFARSRAGFYSQWTQKCLTTPLGNIYTKI